jgi:hypothetical protein
MYYQLLVHHIFHTPSIYSVEMEHDKSLVPASPGYLPNKVEIDEWLDLEQEIGANIIDVVAKVTKFVSPDSLEQVVQIECSEEEAAEFLQHTDHLRFQEIRTSVGFAILGCEFNDIASLTDEPSITFNSYAEARAKFSE